MFTGIRTVVGLGTSLQRKTWLVSVYSTIAALINIGANILLIPVYGTMGAALATLIAYVAMTLMAYLSTSGFIRYPLRSVCFLLP